MRDACGVERGEHLVKQPAAHDAAAAIDDERARAARLAHETASLLLRAAAKDELRRGTEFKIQHVESSLWTGGVLQKGPAPYSPL